MNHLSGDESSVDIDRFNELHCAERVTSDFSVNLYEQAVSFILSEIKRYS